VHERFVGTWPALGRYRPGKFAGMSDFLSVRPNLEVAALQPTVGHLVDVFGFDVEVHDEEMGLALLHRGSVGLAVVRAANPGVNKTTAAYIGVTEVETLHAMSVERGAKVVNPLTDHPWGLRDFVAEIPGGHRLAFGERTAPG
jgi:predicted enzyme related to lactoylglutathione lyase